MNVECNVECRVHKATKSEPCGYRGTIPWWCNARVVIHLTLERYKTS